MNALRKPELLVASDAARPVLAPAPARAGIDAFRDALVSIEAVCAEVGDSERVAELWQRLVLDLDSTIDTFERDGRRYYLALGDGPEAVEGATLTRRERQVLVRAELGYSNKLIAHSLDLSPSTVSTLLARARRKLAHSRGSKVR